MEDWACRHNCSAAVVLVRGDGVARDLSLVDEYELFASLVAKDHQAAGRDACGGREYRSALVGKQTGWHA